MIDSSLVAVDEIRKMRGQGKERHTVDSPPIWDEAILVELIHKVLQSISRDIVEF